MKLSSLIYKAVWEYGMDEAIKIFADAGFEAVDYSLTARAIPWEEEPFTDIYCKGFADYFQHLAKAAAECGVEIYQTHAPYCPTNTTDPELYALTLQQTIRAIYATRYLDCSNIVAHPVLHPDFHNGQNAERCIKTNLEYFGALVPALRETGVTMCIENLHWANKGYDVIPNACSDVEQLITLIDTLNDMYGPLFAACLDTGHARLVGNNPSYMIRKLGHRVRTLHVHDTDGPVDNHWMPGKGDIDWEAFMAALREIGYAGTFNFEADAVFEDLENKLANRTVKEKAADLLCAVGRSMLEL